MEREILQISLGTPACEVTSHLLNLQGLAATTENENSSYCRAVVTHGVTDRLRVPRALLVDTPNQMHRKVIDENEVSSVHNMTWSGRMEPFSVKGLDCIVSPPPATTTSADSSDSAMNVWVHSLQKTSNILATSEFSRYRLNSYQTSTPNNMYSSLETNSRHVNWDDLGNEDEEEEEETEEERRRRLDRQRQQWQRGTLDPLQSHLSDKWDEFLQKPVEEIPMKEPVDDGGGGDSGSHPSLRPNDLIWTDYLAPPLHPRSILTLPTSQETAYYPVASGKSMSLWIEEEMFERVRIMLEDCDSCQGCILSASGFDVFAGLSTQILHYLQDECPSASRIVLSYEDVLQDETVSPSLDLPEKLANNHNQGGEAKNWRSTYIASTRHTISRGMAWYDFTEASHAMLPLRVPVEAYPTRFHATAALATSLEATTLPLRVRPNENLRIGTNSYYYGSLSGDSDFGTVPSLSMSEFLGVVKPRERLSLLEMDALLHPHQADSSLWQNLVEGTSIERDRRMRESPHLAGNRRPRDVLPGRWMLDPKDGGLLSSLSYQEPTNRALHNHFGLAGALRPATQDGIPLPSYTDSLLQGMGIRFRPEQSVATVLNESVAALTKNGYGAGSYWKSVWGHRPVLTILGNTTRAYSHVHEIGNKFKTFLLPRARGFYNRDVSSGTLPEMEDCQEALSSLWDLRDAYQPPDGSGLIVQDGEIQF